MKLENPASALILKSPLSFLLLMITISMFSSNVIAASQECVTILNGTGYCNQFSGFPSEIHFNPSKIKVGRKSQSSDNSYCSFFKFNLSGIPLDATITQVKLKTYPIENPSFAAPYIRAISINPANASNGSEIWLSAYNGTDLHLGSKWIDLCKFPDTLTKSIILDSDAKTLITNSLSQGWCAIGLITPIEGGVYPPVYGTLAGPSASAGRPTLDITYFSGQGHLNITPPDDLVFNGSIGGPFNPSSVTYLIQNTGADPIQWNVSKNANWLDLSSPTSGTLDSGQIQGVAVSINSNANSLGIGSYNATVEFENTTNHSGDSNRNASLTVSPLVHNITITSGPSVDPNPVESAGTAACSVTASCSAGDSISYSWTATGGSFTNPNSRTPTWIAPSNLGATPQNYDLTIEASCSQDSESDSVTVTVNPISFGTSISGIIYEDGNHNDEYDQHLNEEIPNAFISIDETTPILADATGYYQLTNIEPGTKKLDVILSGEVYRTVYISVASDDNRTIDINVNRTYLDQIDLCSAEIVCQNETASLVPYYGLASDAAAIALDACSIKQRRETDPIGALAGGILYTIDTVSFVSELFTAIFLPAHAKFQIIDAVKGAISCSEAVFWEYAESECGGYTSCLISQMGWTGREVVAVSTHSPVDILVYDSSGNVLKLDPAIENLANNELSSPAWIFKKEEGHKEAAIILDPDPAETFLIEIQATPDAGDGNSFDLELFRQHTDGTQQSYTYIDVPITSNGSASAVISNTIEISVDVDIDGDGNIDKQVLPIHDLQLIADPNEGSVYRELWKTHYDHNETVSLRACPNIGYTFTRWEGNVSTTDNPIEITMDDDKQITAIFEKVHFDYHFELARAKYLNDPTPLDMRFAQVVVTAVRDKAIQSARIQRPNGSWQTIGSVKPDGSQGYHYEEGLIASMETSWADGDYVIEVTYTDSTIETISFTKDSGDYPGFPVILQPADQSTVYTTRPIINWDSEIDWLEIDNELGQEVLFADPNSVGSYRGAYIVPSGVLENDKGYLIMVDSNEREGIRYSYRGSVSLIRIQVDADGKTFGLDSEDFSDVPFIHTQPGDKRTYQGQDGYAGTSYTLSTSSEQFLGVNCLRVDQTAVPAYNKKSHLMLMAKDTSDVCWLFKFVEDNTTFFEAASLQEVQRFNDVPDMHFKLASGNYNTGSIFVDPAGGRQEVISTNAELLQYPGSDLVLVWWVSGTDYDYAYHHESSGLIWDIWDDTGNVNGDGWQLELYQNLTFDLNFFSTIASYWMSSNCNISNNWCQGADLAPLRGDGQVNFDDLSVFANHLYIDNTLIHRWTLNETSGTSVVDAVGNLDGTATTDTANWHTVGKINGAFDLNGIDHFIELGGTDTVFSTGSWSVSLWMNTVSTGLQSLISCDSEQSIRSMSINNRKLALWKTGTSWFYGNTILDIGRWYHVVLVYDGAGQYTYYLDGQPDTNWTNWGTTNDTGRIRYIGRYYHSTSTRPFSGKLDDIRIYNRALSADDIQRLYTAEN